MLPHSLIVGAGRSAYGAARLLQKQGARVRVTDITEKYPDEIAALKAAQVEIVIGPQTFDLLEACEQLIVSPGLAPDLPFLREARERGIPIRSEIDLALQHFQGRVLGVTGTNGKSTTTSLIAHMLKDLGLRAEASGNIGVPPSLLLAEGEPPEILVLELSSYQLEFSQAIVNDASVFMSFSEDHMERHKTMERYFAAKWKLLEASSRLCIVPQAVLKFAKKFSAPKLNVPIAQICVDSEVRVRGFDGPEIRLDTKKSRVSGDGISGVRHLPPGLSFHNQLNVLTSALAVQAVQPTPWAQCMRSLGSFTWLPYRFEKIGTVHGYPVYNDSKSTNVESTLVALRSLQDKALVMLGGYPKGESFEAIAQYRDKIGTLVAFGQAAPKISSDLAALHPLVFPTLREALAKVPQLLSEHAGPLVFSPACSSFDEFKNFEDRGAFFNRTLQSHLDPI